VGVWRREGQPPPPVPTSRHVYPDVALINRLYRILSNPTSKVLEIHNPRPNPIQSIHDDKAWQLLFQFELPRIRMYDMIWYVQYGCSRAAESVLLASMPSSHTCEHAIRPKDSQQDSSSSTYPWTALLGLVIAAKNWGPTPMEDGGEEGQRQGTLRWGHVVGIRRKFVDYRITYVYIYIRVEASFVPFLVLFSSSD